MIDLEQRQKALNDIGAYLSEVYFAGVTPDTTAEEYRAMAAAHGRMVGRIAAVLLDDDVHPDMAGKVLEYGNHFSAQMVEGIRSKIGPGGVLSKAAMAEKAKGKE